MVFKKNQLKRVRIYVASGFMLVDILLFLSILLFGKGYILLEPKAHSVVTSQMGAVWNILHMPVNETFGWLLFPYFDPHNLSLSFIVYVVLCFFQMFFVGLLIAMIVNAIINQIKDQR